MKTSTAIGNMSHTPRDRAVFVIEPEPLSVKQHQMREECMSYVEPGAHANTSGLRTAMKHCVHKSPYVLAVVLLDADESALSQSSLTSGRNRSFS